MDKNQFKKIWIQRVSIICSFFVLLNIVLYLFGLNPKIKKLEETNILIENIKRELQEYYVFDTISIEIEKFKDIKNIVDEIKNNVVGATDVEQVFFKKIDEISKRLEIKIENISSEDVLAKESNDSNKIFNLSFKSSFLKTCIFLSEVEKNPFFTIKNLSILSGKNIPQHNVVVKIKVYFSS